MRLRWRPARMSLATKSRVLFGVAAALIIGAALFVQWQRLEQLTRQLNLAAGRAVARVELARHAIDPTSPATRATPASSRPTLYDYGNVRLEPPRFLNAASVGALPEDAFERVAFERFRRRADRSEFTRLIDGPAGATFFYAEPLTFGESCLRCHAAPGSPSPATLADDSRATAAPLVAPYGIVSVQIPNQVRGEQIVLNRIFLIAAGLLSGLLAIVILSFIISRLILRPVRVLQETAEKVSAGDLNIRARINSGDEFQRLSETFNSMLINLKGSADQLQAANRSLDIKMVALAETNVGLNEANRLKNEFLANVSHELRTPLNSILGFAELVRGSPAAGIDAKLTRYVGNIVKSGSNLLELINDLLDIAKIEAGRMEIRPSDLALGDVIDGLVQLVKPLAEAKHLTIVARTLPDVPIVRTDPARLQQVLYNLLSNAVKFSPEGATIDVMAGRIDGERVTIRVVDRGPGIDAAHHGVIFEKFRQVDASATREHGGTGLGLSISQELMRLLHGTIGVDSEPGKGATFWCVLPIRLELADEDDARDEGDPPRRSGNQG